MENFRQKIDATCYVVKYTTTAISETELKIEFDVYENKKEQSQRKRYKFITICNNYSKKQFHAPLKIENIEDCTFQWYDSVPVQLSTSIIEHYPDPPPSGCGHKQPDEAD